MPNPLKYKKLLPFFLVFLGIASLVTTANAAQCNYQPLNVVGGGADMTEYNSACFFPPPPPPVPCCTVNSVQMIAQNYFAAYRRDFIMDAFYKCPVEKNFKQTADEMRNAVLFKIAAMGAFIDASIFNNTLRDLQVLSTQSLQTYTPSQQICRFGSLSKALAASDGRVDADRLVLGEAGLSKNLGTKSSISAAGRGAENLARLKGFADSFCHLKDNDDGLDKLCATATPVKDLDQNRDIDFARLMNGHLTMNADLTNENLTRDETNLMAMAHYLYGHRQIAKRLSGEELLNTGNALLYSEYRSVVARRAAAQNSFNTHAAMRMAGSGASDDYMKAMLKNIGVSDKDFEKYIGAKTTESEALKSSYNAQMSLLTKQLYQDPAFYANLMESKANTKRMSAAMQGVGLMQSRDLYRSLSRSEVLLAIMVELEARKIAITAHGTKQD